ARADFQSSLRDGSRTALAATRDRVRAVLVASEVALALALLVAAALLVRSAIYLTHVNPGFDPRGVLTARIAVSGGPDSARVARRTTKLGANHATDFFLQLARALRGQPGVAAVAVTSAAPLGGGGGINGVIPEGKEPNQSNAVLARRRLVSAGYLTAMGIPLIAGRDIDEHDVSGALRVIVVSKALANAAWPNENPIGKRLMCCEGTPDDPRYKTVVGVAADVHTGGPAQELRPEFYMPLVQAPPDAWRWIEGTMTVVVRTRSGDPLALAPMVRTVAHGIDPSVPVGGVGTMDGWIRDSMAQSRFQLLLMVTLASVALLLAAIGIYSVIAYFVALRTHEIGVRVALGATSGDIVRLLTLGGLRPVLAGATAGTIAAVWGTRLLRGSLHGVANTDPASFAAVVAAVVLVALVAILIPARRAATVDPTAVLHG
ncbi:MAG TPA: FtsX-like permease family protein, partial [Gemmatimonadaceae bacterium]|nr:FtsX-like permease family protein [Gemmatimonadaceae bacterium]